MNNYQNKWESRSSIRTRPRKFIDFNQRGSFFPYDKQVLLELPEIKILDSEVQNEILLQSFHKYLNDIITLEVFLINSACNKLIYKDLAVKYSEEDKINAYTIIIDEYYHVYNAYDMMMQLDQHFTQVPKLAYPISDASNAMTEIKNRIDTKYHDIFEIVAICIFETTLVRELIEFFNSEDIHPSIKHYINDHMNDEARHHVYFYNILCHTWNNVPNDYKENIGKHLVDFVKLYLNINSEKSYNLQILGSILKDSNKAQKLIDGIYSDFYITIELPIVKGVLEIFKKSGILDSEYVKKYFMEQNLYI